MREDGKTALLDASELENISEAGHRVLLDSVWPRLIARSTRVPAKGTVVPVRNAVHTNSDTHGIQALTFVEGFGGLSPSLPHGSCKARTRQIVGLGFDCIDLRRRIVLRRVASRH